MKIIKKARRKRLLTKRRQNISSLRHLGYRSFINYLKFTKIKKPPGRPIVSGIESLFSHEYMDISLQPLTQGYLSYLRDIKHLINILKDTPVDDYTLLVTIDIESLYANIKQQDALTEIWAALETKSDLKPTQRKFLVKALDLAMTSSYFWHDGYFFNQIKGVAMGQNLPPV